MTDLATDQVLGDIPAGLRTPLIAAFTEIRRNYIENRWEPAELNGGKLCEAVYSIVSGALTGQFPATPSKPSDMVSACRALESIPSDPLRPGDRSLRILIPRAIPYLYEIRNNRGVGHVGGDVDPNKMDATTVLATANWIMAELVRVFHSVDSNEAQNIVDMMVERTHPLVWDTGEQRRVLDPQMKMSDQTLCLLYSTAEWTDDKDLFRWVEYSALGPYRKNVLEPLHKHRMIEWDRPGARAKITPLGARHVEDALLH